MSYGTIFCCVAEPQRHVLSKPENREIWQHKYDLGSWYRAMINRKLFSVFLFLRYILIHRPCVVSDNGSTYTTMPYPPDSVLAHMKLNFLQRDPSENSNPPKTTGQNLITAMLQHPNVRRPLEV